MPEGDLIVVFTRTEEHLSPDGAIVLCRSRNGGESWSPAQTVYDTPIDDRESGFTTLSDGRVVLHLWSTFHTAETYASLPPDSYTGETLERWKLHVRKPAYRASASLHGAWCMISRDGGRSWSSPMRGKDAIHGGIQLRDSSLLVASYREEGGGIGVHLARSPEGPWIRLATINAPDSLDFAEPHVAQLAAGRIIMLIRVTAKPYAKAAPNCVLWETYSDDSGRTWAKPFATSLWGFPPHLTILSDGRVLCTYGYRRPPYGERACLSEDGIEWSPGNEVTLRDDAPDADLGYPASLEVKPGVVLTVYYQRDVPPGTENITRPPDPGRKKPGILGTVWRVPPRGR